MNRDNTQQPDATRLAPSPTGALHLGNALSFVINWALARRHGWLVWMRLEDLSGPRVKPETAAAAMDTLLWLGLTWEQPVLNQVDDLKPYHDALLKLYDKSVVYPSPHSRKQIEEALAAPHADEHELVFPTALRPASDHMPPNVPQPEFFGQESWDTAWRLLVPDRWMTFTDQLLGPQCYNLLESIGDFIVATRSGMPAYQLAVVVDDARQGVTDVVRGGDLLSSTARQLYLYELLELPAPKRWWHLPMVIGEDGRRLAKRHGDTRIATYRDDHQTDPTRVLGLLGYWCDITATLEPMTLDRFVEELDLERLPRDTITFKQEQHQWLIS